MAEYYGNVDYNQGYSGYPGAAAAGFPPTAGAPGQAQQWSQAAPPGVPPTGYPPVAAAPPEAHYQGYPPSQYGQAQANAGPIVPPAAAYNGTPAYAQPPAGPYGQAAPPAGSGNGYGVPPPIAPAGGPYGGPGGPPGAYASRGPPQGGYPDEVSGRPNFRGPPGNGRAPGPVFNKGFGGGRGSFGGQGMEEQNDTVFVSGLPENTTEDQLSDFFGSIGIIKLDKKTGKNKIWIYRDKASGKPKGEATVTFDDPPTATSAIDWFNGKDFFGSTIKVELAQRKSNNFGGGRAGFPDRDAGPRGGGGSRDGGRDTGREGGRDAGRFERDNRTSVRDGDWRCPNDECNNNNFAWRTECNRCKTAKPEDAGGEAPRRGGGPPPFGGERRGPGGRPPMGGGSGGFRGGYSQRGSPRNGGPPGGFDRSRGPPGGPREGGRGGGRGGGPMRGSDSRRAAPY